MLMSYPTVMCCQTCKIIPLMCLVAIATFPSVNADIGLAPAIVVMGLAVLVIVVLVLVVVLIVVLQGGPSGRGLVEDLAIRVVRQYILLIRTSD